MSPFLLGTKIPELSFEAYFKKDFAKMNFKQFLGKWLVVFFYPADFTFVCPTELEALAELYSDFQKEGAEVVSISNDSVFVHKAWHDHSPSIAKINFPMIADPSGAISRFFGVYLPDEGESLRGSFLIDPDGIVQALEIHARNIGRNPNEFLRKLQAAKFVREHGGEVCPVNWKPGAKTLKPGVDLVGKI